MSFVDLVGKSVVVTGGARGIGRAIAHEFANAGADVVIGDFRSDEATKTALELSEVSGNRVVAVRTDVTSLEEVHQLRDEALRLFGKIDVL
ncbi:MAG TPA: SDR family NAD(P)-dependent oxidoreductase, partial [Blastocatellia bacterium]|nr:SDR family NAD(P)-dependent oxidoreductase [Blastocatellia bacterium]